MTGLRSWMSGNPSANEEAAAEAAAATTAPNSPSSPSASTGSDKNEGTDDADTRTASIPTRLADNPKLPPSRLSTISRMYDVDGDGVLNPTEKAMRDMDKSGRGFLTNEKVYKLMEQSLELQHQFLNMKRMIIGLAVFTVILALSNLATAFAAASLAKDTSVSQSNGISTLTDRAGHDLATLNKGIVIQAITEETQYMPQNDAERALLQGFGTDNIRGSDAHDNVSDPDNKASNNGGDSDNLRGSDATSTANADQQVDTEIITEVSSKANSTVADETTVEETDGQQEQGEEPSESASTTDADKLASGGLTFLTHFINLDEAEAIFQSCQQSTPTTITHRCQGGETISKIGCNNARRAGRDGHTFLFENGVKIICDTFSDNSRAGDAMGGCTIIGLSCNKNFNRLGAFYIPQCGANRPNMTECGSSCECEYGCCVTFTTPVCMGGPPNNLTSCIYDS